MYIKFNNKNKKLTTSRRKTIIVVASIHVFILVIIFLVFVMDSLFKPKKINSINVSVVSPSDYRQQKTSSKAVAASKPKLVRKKKAVIKKKTIKTKPKKTWKALDPSQIIKSTNQVQRKRPTSSRPKYKPLKASDIVASLRSNLKNINFKSVNNASSNPSMLNYYDKVRSSLYSLWKQPSRAAIGSSNPSVLISISVNSSGKVVSAKIIRKSGVSVMDRSVMKLLSSLSRLPKPPEGAMTFEADMVLQD
ncbi:MAG: TonB C-terminal domain-containing protein [bacterium]|nr:TonB C-terminal domain-containing protein [bacterium]